MRVVKAERFALEDADGNERATLGLDDQNNPSLCLFDDYGNERAGIRVVGGDAKLFANHADGRPAAAVVVRANGTAGVYVSAYGEDPTPGVCIVVVSDRREAGILVQDDAGKYQTIGVVTPERDSNPG